MPLGSYDSPTFLAQKDKYMMGLSLPELLLCMLVIFLWFVVTLLLPYPTVIRMLITAVGSLVCLLLIFVKLSGINVVIYLMLTLVRVFSKPSYEDTRSGLLYGDPAWLESQRLAAEKRSEGGRFGRIMGGRRKLKKQMQTQAVEERRQEVEAEVNRQFIEGAIGAESMIRDGIRSLVKGK